MAFSTYQYEFTGGDRNEKVKSIDFFNTTPLLNVYRIKFFKEEDITGEFQTKQFRYSFDNVVWSNWNTLTQQNVAAIQTRDNPLFYFHVQYTRTGIGSANILRFYLFYESDTSIPGGPPPDASIDADYLGGQPPSYYLDRENQTGPFLDLQAQNVPIGGTDEGTYFGRSDTSIGTTLFFKRIKGSSTISVTGGSTGIITLDSSGSASGVYNSNLDPSSIAMPTSIGGISSGTTVGDLNGNTFSKMWDDLLFPTAYPTLISPNNTFVVDAASLQEIGASINITFTSTFFRGSISPQYTAASDKRSGLPNGYTYTGAQIAGTYPSVSLSDTQNATGYIVLKGIQSWTNRVGYDAGVQPYDSKGALYMSPLPDGSTGIKTLSFEGVYPLFGTTSSITALNQISPLYSMISANNIVISMANESGGNKQRLDIPFAWLTSRPLKGIQTYNSFSNTWEYQGGSQASSLVFWPYTTGITHIIQGNIIPYLRYTYNGVDRGNINIRLVF